MSGGLASGMPRSTTFEVLELLESLPPSFKQRSDFIQMVVQAGQPRAIAAWLAMSLQRSDEQFTLCYNLPAIRKVLLDFQQRDMWSTLAAGQADTTHLVVAGKSFVWQTGDDERLSELERAGVCVHHLPESGHWVHVDARQTLSDLLLKFL